MTKFTQLCLEENVSRPFGENLYVDSKALRVYTLKEPKLGFLHDRDRKGKRRWSSCINFFLKSDKCFGWDSRVLVTLHQGKILKAFGAFHTIVLPDAPVIFPLMCVSVMHVAFIVLSWSNQLILFYPFP